MVTSRPSRRWTCRRTLASLLLLGRAALAQAQAEPASLDPAATAPGTPPPAIDAPVTAEPAPAPPRPPGEWYLALLGGPAWHAAGEVTASDQGITQPGVVVSQQVAWRPDAVVGLRLGAWLGPHLGGAMELGETAAKAEGLTLRVTTLSLVPLVRLPLLRSAGAPEGWLHLHLGVSLTAAVEGQGSASLPGLPAPVSGAIRGAASSGGRPSLGAGLLIGLALQRGPVVLFVEQRFARLDLTFSDLFQEVRTTLVSRQTVLGAGLRFGGTGPPAAPAR